MISLRRLARVQREPVGPAVAVEVVPHESAAHRRLEGLPERREGRAPARLGQLQVDEDRDEPVAAPVAAAAAALGLGLAVA